MGSAALRVSAPAKVNLYLSVGARRPDGYHDVTTVLQALELHDTVTLTPGRPFSFACTPDVGVSAEDNLAYRAARGMAERFGRALDVAIEVEKRIPSAAGLGGASADAAAVVRGLAVLWDLKSDDPGLVAVARALGSDVPFFLVGGAALYRGRGDVFVRQLPSIDADVVLVRPAESVATADAYAAFDSLPAAPSPELRALTDALRFREIELAGKSLHNNMTPASQGLVPAIGEILDLLSADAGVLGAAMAGSGSAVFGICTGPDVAARLATEARGSAFWATATRTTDHGCVLEPA